MSKPSAKTDFPWTYVFLFAVAAFASWVYFGEYQGGQEKEKAKEEASALLPFSNSNVIEISIRSKSPGDAPGVLTTETHAGKTGDEWRVDKPFDDAGDPMTIDNFLGTISTEKIKETVVEGPDIFWKTYGLDQPVIDAFFVAKQGDGEPVKRSVQIGSVDALEGHVYARFDGENRVVLMSSTARAALQKDARDLRDKHFFRKKDKPVINSLVLSRSGFPKIEFVKEKDVWLQKNAQTDSWTLDQAAVKSFVDSVVGLRGNDVWAEDKTDAKVLKMRNLVRPGIEIFLGGENGENYDVKIAPLEKAQSVAAGFGSERPHVFSVYKAQIESFSKSIDDFRDLKFPFQFKIAEVTAIELERPAGAVSLPILQKKDGKWIVDPVDTRFAGKDVKSELVEQLMAEVNAFSAMKMLPAKFTAPKLGPKGSLRMAFFAAKNKKLAEFIFNPSGETVLVSSSVTPGKTFEIEKALMDALTLEVSGK